MLELVQTAPLKPAVSSTFCRLTWSGCERENHHDEHKQQTIQVKNHLKMSVPPGSREGPRGFVVPVPGEGSFSPPVSGERPENTKPAILTNTIKFFL